MKSYRPDKVASVIREIVGDMIANHLQDPRISRFASVTRVEVSGDLAVAKVYISVLGSESDERTTMRGLQNARGRLQGAVARGVSVRQCPQLQLQLDGSLKKAAEICRIIDENVPPRDALADDEETEPGDEARPSEGPA